MWFFFILLSFFSYCNILIIYFFIIFLKKNKKKAAIGGYQKPLANQKIKEKVREKRPIKQGNQKTIKQLLGELYADKVYLEQLLEDDRKNYENNDNTLTFNSN